MASLFKRKTSPYWYISWYDTDKGMAGNPKSTKCKSERDAQKFLKRWIEEKEKERREHLRIVPMNVSKLYEFYVRSRKNEGKALSNETEKLFKESIRRLNLVIPPETYIAEYTPKHYDRYVESLESIAQNTRAIYTGKLFSLFRFAVNEKLIKSNPFKVVASEEKEIYIMSDKEAQTIIKLMSNFQYKHLFLFLFSSAFRIQEALNLKRKDIRDGHIYLIGKGNKMAYIPIVKGIEAIFKEMNIDNMDKEDLLFPYQYFNVRIYFKRRLKENNLPKIKIHDIRRYCLSKLANAGVPINFVKTFARHSSIKTTLKYYVKQDMDLLKEEINNKVDIYNVITKEPKSEK